MPRPKHFWLLKTEPGSYSIDDLAAEPKKTTFWDGVRNYQARNYMRDDMKLGDGVLFYHSGSPEPSIVGTARIVRESYPDHTQFDENAKHYDPKASLQNPRWFMVDIQLDTIFKTPLPLADLRGVSALKEMELLRNGSRLSVQPVRKKEFDAIIKLSKS